MPEGTGDLRVDIGGRAIVPGFVDSHTHLVFAGDRSAEFAARAAGLTYEAGGILTTVAATRAASDEVLDAAVSRLAAEALRSGTTTLECKSGYGLTTGTRSGACASPEATPKRRRSWVSTSYRPSSPGGRTTT